MAALCKSFVRRSTQPFNRFDSPVCDRCFIFLKSKEFTFEVLVIETVIDKVESDPGRLPQRLLLPEVLPDDCLQPEGI